MKPFGESDDTSESDTRRDERHAARIRDGVLAGACLLGTLVHGAYVATARAPRGSSMGELLVNVSLTGLCMGLAVSGLRSTRKWVTFMCALILTVALVHLLAPRVTLAAVERIYDLCR